jgi:hypothetical protein
VTSSITIFITSTSTLYQFMPLGSKVTATPDSPTLSLFPQETLGLTDTHEVPVPSTYSVGDGRSNSTTTAPVICGYYARKERSSGRLADGYATSIGVSGVYYTGCWSQVLATSSMTVMGETSANRTLATFANSTGIGSSSVPGQGLIVTPPFMSRARSLEGTSSLCRLIILCGIYSTLFLL